MVGGAPTVESIAMTYLQFHLLFLVPAIAGLGLRIWYAQSMRPSYRKGLLFIVAIAVLYTTPWDNYLVSKQVWTYGEERVLAVLGFVPLEEYLFFALQPLLTGLWVLGLGGRFLEVSHRPSRFTARAVGGLAYLTVGLCGLVLLQWNATLYLGLILVWASPMLLLQWLYGGPWLWAQRRQVAVGVAVPTVYLCIADRLAIEWGIWRISEQYTVHVSLAGLPMEEALFFLLTNLLVVQGLLLAVRELETGWIGSPIYGMWQRLVNHRENRATKSFP